jgi:hypothetical protein
VLSESELQTLLKKWNEESPDASVDVPNLARFILVEGFKMHMKEGVPQPVLLESALDVVGTYLRDNDCSMVVKPERGGLFSMTTPSVVAVSMTEHRAVFSCLLEFAKKVLRKTMGK